MRVWCVQIPQMEWLTFEYFQELSRRRMLLAAPTQAPKKNAQGMPPGFAISIETRLADHIRFRIPARPASPLASLGMNGICGLCKVQVSASERHPFRRSRLRSCTGNVTTSAPPGQELAPQAWIAANNVCLSPAESVRKLPAAL